MGRYVSLDENFIGGPLAIGESCHC
jgi:hypothetical protein